MIEDRASPFGSLLNPQLQRVRRPSCSNSNNKPLRLRPVNHQPHINSPPFRYNTHPTRPGREPPSPTEVEESPPPTEVVPSGASALGEKPLPTPPLSTPPAEGGVDARPGTSPQQLAVFPQPQFASHPNPPLGAHLQRFWKVWGANGASDWVVSILRWGYRLQFWERPPLTRVPMRPSEGGPKHHIVASEIQKLLQKGAI